MRSLNLARNHKKNIKSSKIYIKNILIKNCCTFREALEYLAKSTDKSGGLDLVEPVQKVLPAKPADEIELAPMLAKVMAGLSKGPKVFDDMVDFITRDAKRVTDLVNQAKTKAKAMVRLIIDSLYQGDADKGKLCALRDPWALEA